MNQNAIRVSTQNLLAQVLKLLIISHEQFVNQVHLQAQIFNRDILYQTKSLEMLIYLHRALSRKAIDLQGLVNFINQVIVPMQSNSQITSYLKNLSLTLSIQIEIDYTDVKNNRIKRFIFGQNSNLKIKFICQNEDWFLLQDSNDINRADLQPANRVNKIINKSGTEMNLENFNQTEHYSSGCIIDQYVQAYSLSKCEEKLFLLIIKKSKICFKCNKEQELIPCNACSIFYCKTCIVNERNDNQLVCRFCNSKIRVRIVKKEEVPQLSLFDSNRVKCEFCVNPTNDSIFFCSKCGSFRMEPNKLDKCVICKFLPTKENSRKCLFC